MTMKVAEPILQNVSEKDILHCAELLKSVGHPIRMAIIDLLGLRGTLCVTDIHQALGIEQAVASHHLGILKGKGLLASDRDGKHTRYTLVKRELLQVLVCIRNCAVS